MRVRLVGSLLVVAVVAAGCGGDDDGGDAEADQAAVDRAIAAFEDSLEADGFEPSDPDTESDSLEFESEECQEFSEAFPSDDEKLPGETAGAESDEFERGELSPDGGVQEQVEAKVAFVEDGAALEDLLALYRDDRLGPCLEEALSAAFEEQQAEIGPVTIADVELEELEAPDVGDDAVALRVTATLGAAGFEFPFATDVAVAISDRLAAQVALTAIGGDAEADAGDLLSALFDEAQR